MELYSSHTSLYRNFSNQSMKNLCSRIMSLGRRALPILDSQCSMNCVGTMNHYERDAKGISLAVTLHYIGRITLEEKQKRRLRSKMRFSRHLDQLAGWN